MDRGRVLLGGELGLSLAVNVYIHLPIPILSRRGTTGKDLFLLSYLSRVTTSSSPLDPPNQLLLPLGSTVDFYTSSKPTPTNQPTQLGLQLISGALSSSDPVSYLHPPITLSSLVGYGQGLKGVALLLLHQGGDSLSP